MKKKQRKSRWKLAAALLALVYVLVVLAGVLIWPNREPFLAEVPLGDGVHRLRLLHLGPEPVNYAWRDPRPRAIQLITPTFVRRIRRPAEVMLDGRAPFRLWFAQAGFEAPAGSLLLRPVDCRGEYVNHINLHHKRIELVDSRGFTFLPGLMDHSYRHPGMLAAERTCLPRRDEMLTIRIADQDTAGEPLELTVKNPFYRTDIPDWQGSQIPQTLVFDDTTISLKSLEVQSGHLIGTVHVDGRNWRAVPFSLWFEDATGNCGLWLSPDEPAWKAHLTIVPQTFEVLPATSIFQLPPIEQPAEGQAVRLDRTVKIAGLDVRLLELGTKYDGFPSAEKSGASAKDLIFKIRVPQSLRSHPMFCRTVDADGTRSRRTGHRATVPQGEKEWLVQFSVGRPEGNAPVTLELGLGAERELTFMIAPPAELKTKMREHVISTRIRKRGQGMGEGRPVPNLGLPSRPSAGGIPR